MTATLASAHDEIGLIAASVAASVALHAAVLALGAPIGREALVEPPRVLSVMLQEPPAKLEAPAPPEPSAPTPRPAVERSTPRIAAAPPSPPRAATPPVAAAPALPSPAEPVLDTGPKEDRKEERSAIPEPRAAAAHQPASPPEFRAAYLRNPPPPYPAAARRSGDEGTVTLRVLVSAEGAPREVTLERSSGSSVLDTVALATVKAWRFAPARRGGEPHEAWVLVPIVFKLEPRG